MPHTMRDQIAEAFPLHFQRIVEATIAHYGALSGDMFDDEALATAGHALGSAFPWDMTDEGFGYWSTLARGAGW